MCNKRSYESYMVGKFLQEYSIFELLLFLFFLAYDMSSLKKRFKSVVPLPTLSLQMNNDNLAKKKKSPS